MAEVPPCRRFDTLGATPSACTSVFVLWGYPRSRGRVSELGPQLKFIVDSGALHGDILVSQYGRVGWYIQWHSDPMSMEIFIYLSVIQPPWGVYSILPAWPKEILQQLSIFAF
jgi:hypothetical protein